MYKPQIFDILIHSFNYGNNDPYVSQMVPVYSQKNLGTVLNNKIMLMYVQQKNLKRKVE